MQVKEEEKLQAIKLYLQDVYYILQKDNTRGVVFCCLKAILKNESNWIDGQVSLPILVSYIRLIWVQNRFVNGVSN